MTLERSETVEESNTQLKTPISETVAKTFGLLDLFCATPIMTAGEVAHRAKMPLSTTFRLLNTLVHLSFLDYQKSNKTYRLGLKLLEYGQVVSQQLDIPQIALPILSQLVAETGETAHLSIRDGDEGVFIAKVDAPHNIRMHTPLGRRVPLHAGASMMTIFAHLDDSEIASYIMRGKAVAITPDTICDPDQIWMRISTIREQGFAISRGEQTLMAGGVGAPVFDHRSSVVAGLTISGPIQRMTDDKMMIYSRLVVDAAALLSRRLGKG